MVCRQYLKGKNMVGPIFEQRKWIWIAIVAIVIAGVAETSVFAAEDLFLGIRPGTNRDRVEALLGPARESRAAGEYAVYRGTQPGVRLVTIVYVDDPPVVDAVFVVFEEPRSFDAMSSDYRLGERTYAFGLRPIVEHYAPQGMILHRVIKGFTKPVTAVARLSEYLLDTAAAFRGFMPGWSTRTEIERTTGGPGGEVERGMEYFYGGENAFCESICVRYGRDDGRLLSVTVSSEVVTPAWLVKLLFALETPEHCARGAGRIEYFATQGMALHFDSPGADAYLDGVEVLAEDELERRIGDLAGTIPQRLLGDWRLRFHEGKPVPEAEEMTLTAERDGRLTFRNTGGTVLYRGRIELDRSFFPYRARLFIDGSAEEVYGIVRLEEGRFTLKIDESGKNRFPFDFRVEPMLADVMVYKRSDAGNREIENVAAPALVVQALSVSPTRLLPGTKMRWDVVYGAITAPQQVEERWTLLCGGKPVMAERRVTRRLEPGRTCFSVPYDFPVGVPGGAYAVRLRVRPEGAGADDWIVRTAAFEVSEEK